MSEEDRTIYVAVCLTCEPSTHHNFSAYEDRSNWVGQHRVKTAHQVAVWQEPK